MVIILSRPNYGQSVDLRLGDRLLVGLSTGSLRIYRVNDPIDESSDGNRSPTDGDRPISQSGPKPADLMRELEKFSKYKVEQLAVVKEANILVSLSNSQVHIHDLQSYGLQETLVKAKGASTFSVTSNVVKDESTDVPSIVSRLAVAVKRRLILWSWHDSEFAPETSEITLISTIRALKWATGTKLIAGLNSSYVLVDVETSTVTDIIGPGSIGGAPGQDGGRFSGAGVASMGYLGMTSPPPLATPLGEGEMLLAKDINTLFIDTDGNSLGRRQIPWSVAPEAVGYSYPYLLALQATKGTLEVRNPETLSLLQTIPLPSAHQLHVPQPNVSLAHAGKGFLVLSERCIWSMKALVYDAPINALVAQSRLDEALSLLGMLEDALLKDKEGRVRDIKIIKAQQLFDQRRYRDSIDLFTEVSAPPERVIRMFPPFIAGDASPLSPLHKENLKEDHFETRIDGTSPTKPSGESSAKDPNEGSERRDGDKPLEGRDLKTATEELRGFLVSARTKFKKILDPDGNVKVDILQNMARKEVREIASLIGESTLNASDNQGQLLQTAKLVDTTLFRAYMFVSPSFAGPLFRIDNFCDPDVVNERLIEAHRYNDLVDFFYGKKLHRQALELLKKFGEAAEENEDAPQFHGPQRTVAYLQNLPSEMIELILHFAEWPLRKNADLGMEVFLADTENAETLQRPRVLEFLQSIDQKLARTYLEHIILELNDTTPDFHQRLVNIYIDRLKSSSFANDNDQAAWKQKTLDFLKTSKNYQAYKALQKLSKDDPNLFEARAIVLSNMGQHRQALDIYVFQLKDADKAEEYCNQIYLTETATAPAPTPHGRATDIDPSDAPPSIYHTLLSLYLSPPPPHKPQWGPALNILAKHGARMPASSTLDLIPEILPIKELESYFRGRIRTANTLVNEGRIVAGMRSSLAFSEEAKLRLGDGIRGGNDGRNRRVIITEDRVCGVCHKRFGGSAIKVMPKYVEPFVPLKWNPKLTRGYHSNTVTHYGCSTW